MVFVIAALASAEMGEVVNELDRRYPFDHLEAELVLATQAKRGAVKDAEGSAVHLVREDSKLMAHVRQLVNVIIATAVRAIGERVEDDVARARVLSKQMHPSLPTRLGRDRSDFYSPYVPHRVRLRPE